MSSVYSYSDENAGPRVPAGHVKPVASNVIKPAQSNISIGVDKPAAVRRPTGRVALGDISNRAAQPIDANNLKKKVSR